MQTDRKREKLSREILEFLFISLAISVFTFGFLYSTAGSMAGTYFARGGILLTEGQKGVLDIWLKSICTLSAAVVFLVLFLFLLGQRISYLLTIIRGVGALRERRMDFSIPMEGNDEFTELAESINYLASSERELARRERQLREERERWIRALSHDIRTPLTSVLAYSQYLEEKGRMEEQEMRDFIGLVRAKGEQIRELTDRILDQGRRNLEKVDHMGFLMEQLAQEWEEILEGRFKCGADVSGCGDFAGMADIYSLRRIFDNLASNAERYAAPELPVKLTVKSEGRRLTILQENGVDGRQSAAPDSRGIGVDSIRLVAEEYGGTVEACGGPGVYRLRVVLDIDPVEEL